MYNGQLSLRVGSGKSIRDSKANVIEDRLGDVILLLYQASNALRVQREAQEAAERKREEEERQRNARRERYNQEVDRTNALVNEAEDFEIACKIRAYISAVEKKETLTEEEVAWIEWAKQKADWYALIFMIKTISGGFRRLKWVLIEKNYRKTTENFLRRNSK